MQLPDSRDSGSGVDLYEVQQQPATYLAGQPLRQRTPAVLGGTRGPRERLQGPWLGPVASC